MRIWLCVPNGPRPLIWAQQKSPSIGPLIVRLSAYLSGPSSALPSPPSLHPSSLPPPLCPRPHWSAMPRLLPTDHSAWCLLCLGEVNKLSGQIEWEPRGPEEPFECNRGTAKRNGGGTEAGEEEADLKQVVERREWGFGGNNRGCNGIVDFAVLRWTSWFSNHRSSASKDHRSSAFIQLENWMRKFVKLRMVQPSFKSEGRKSFCWPVPRNDKREKGLRGGNLKRQSNDFLNHW